MELNNLIGVSGSINSGKDLVGEMIQYIDTSDNPTYDEFDYENNLISSYTIKKCADKLKDVVALLIGCTRAQLEDEEFKNRELGEEWWRYERTFRGEYQLMIESDYNKLAITAQMNWTLVKLTPRLMLQLFGTQGGRMVVHPNIWVNSLFTDYVSGYVEQGVGWIETDEDYPKWIITDIRFPQNEGVAVSSRGGLLIGIKRHFALKQPQYESLAIEGFPYDIPVIVGKVNAKLYASLTHESETSMGDHSWCDVVIENNGTKEELFNNVLNAVTNKVLI